uniref:Ig-like domain-containing protein n=1 Tax=Sinocyclocheilus rhinocerous TaxID=307959 RepID=A0A673L485_9TELE
MFLKTTITYCTFKQQLLTDQSSIMVSHGFYWTLWMLSCFGQYLGEDLQFSELANGAVGGSVVFAPDNPPSTSIDTVQWGFGTTIILTAQDRVSFDRITLALELWNLRLEDSGIYRLTVVTSAGHQLSGETSLQVFDEITNVSSEGTGSISSVQWMKDNSPLSPSNSIIFSSDNRSVSISTVQRSDSGEYQCTYRNPVNSTVNGPEDVSIKGQDVVDLGVRVSLSCSANSEPSASFSWKFNGRDTDVTTDTFTIDQTDFTHSGDYECTVVMRGWRLYPRALRIIRGSGGSGNKKIRGTAESLTLFSSDGLCGFIYSSNLHAILNKGFAVISLILKSKAAGMSNAMYAQSRNEIQDLIKHNSIIQRIVK